MAHPDFGRSVNPISIRGDRLCPPNYYWHTRILRPSDGPGVGACYKISAKIRGVGGTNSEIINKHAAAQLFGTIEYMQ